MPSLSPGYEAAMLATGVVTVDARGRVWRRERHGRPCAPYRAEGPRNGYLVVTVYLDGRQRAAYAHRLAYVALVGPIPEGHLVRNRNGDHSDNRPANLEVVPPTSTPVVRRRAATGVSGASGVDDRTGFFGGRGRSDRR